MQSASSSSSVLDVSGGNIGDDGAARVAEVLQQGRKLEEVRLDLNGISDAAIPQLARSLRGCPSLKKLSLRGNAICDDGAAVLAAALAGGRCTARELDLSQNAIGDKGAAALGEALEGNAALKRLHLADNAISDAGAVRLVKALGVNRTLADLDLEANRITPPVVEHLSEAARGLGKSVRLARQKGREPTEAECRAAAARAWFDGGGAWKEAAASASWRLPLARSAR